jgi:radical SAM superfamily enzyme YgiQ (UPF0313 family)
MNDILLLFPSFHEPHNRYPPLGLAYLAAALRDRGHSVRIRDAAEYLSIDEFRAELMSSTPRILGISVLSVHYEKALAAAKIAKQIDPQIIIVFGGAHPTAVPLDCAQQPEIDYIVTGEGEEIFPLLVEALQGDHDISGIPGIVYRQNQDIKVQERVNFISSLDDVPLPARDLLSMGKYLHKAPTLPLPYPSTSIVPSRGCFGNCRFCQPTLRKLFGRKMRYRRPEKVVDEILRLKQQYGIRGLFFADDEPTWNKVWMEALCQEMIDRKVNIRWICPSRVDTVDLDMLQIMSRAGCIQVGFGVETGSQRVMNYYRKGTRIEQVVQAFELCRQAGIIARANIMIGAPEETAQDVHETIHLIETIKPDLIAVSVTTPIVGTDLFHHAKITGLLRKASLSDYDRFYIGTMKRTLSDDEIRGYIRKIVAAYRKQILQDLRSLRGLSRRKHLLFHSALHWITMLANPRMLFHDISYYLRYDSKEKD